MSGPTNVYSQSAGTSVIAQPLAFAAAPGPTNVNFPLGQIVIVEATSTAYILASKTTTNGVVTANWTTISTASGDIDQITALNNSGVVTPTVGNVNIGGSGSVIVDGAGDTLTVSLTGLTANTVLTGQGTATIGTLGPLTNGQLVVGSTGSAPVAAALTSTGGSIAVTNGAGSISLDVAAPLSPARGGTGVVSPAAHTLPVAEGASAFTFLGPLTNGQLLIGSTGVDPVPANLTSTGATITITNGAGSINLEAASASVTIAGDTGSITGSSLTVFSNQATQNSGSSVGFSNSGTTSTLNVTDGNTNTIVGSGSGNATIGGSGNVGLGAGVLSALTSGSTNCGFGNNCLHAATTGNANLAFGNMVLSSVTTGGFNCGVGANTLQSLTAGSGNSAFGVSSLSSSLVGTNNTAIGNNAGVNYTAAESNNVLLGSPGVGGESNTIRIGNQGGGSLQQNTCFIAGIAGVVVSNLNLATINTATGQMGSTASPSVSGSITAGTTLTATAGNITATNGNLVLGHAGNKINIVSGANASIGTSAAMTAGTIIIGTTAVTPSSIIFLTANTLGGTPGTLSAPQASIVGGSSFTIVSSSNTDTSTVNWWIVN